MKKLILVISSLLIFVSFSYANENDCYVDLENKTKIDNDLILNISMSIISKFVTKIMPPPVSGISYKKDCFYRVSLQSAGDELFLTFSGKGLKSFGSSKKKGSDGFKEALVLALLRGVEDQREKICREYGKDLEDCKTIMYWMDLKIPEHRFLFNVSSKLIVNYDYLIFDNFGVGYSYSSDKITGSANGLPYPIVYNYKAHFLNASYIKNIIPQINVGIILGLLVSGDVDLEASSNVNFDWEKSKSIKLLNSSKQMTIFGGYQIDNIEYIIGLQSTDYEVSATFNNCYIHPNTNISNCNNYKFLNYKILSPMIGIGYLF
jgi:hypothetical protein